MPEFDFSEFHPLDHNPIIHFVECNHWYGGTLRHLELEWEFRTGRHIRDWFGRQTQCRFGRHNWDPFWSGRYRLSGLNPLEQTPDGYMCSYCYERKTDNNESD